MLNGTSLAAAHDTCLSGQRNDTTCKCTYWYKTIHFKISIIRASFYPSTFVYSHFFPKTESFLLFAKSVNLCLQVAGKCISDTLFDFKAYVVHQWWTQKKVFLTTKTLEWHYWRHSGVFIINFELISLIVRMFTLLL